MVLTRLPGIQGKLEGSWEGLFEVLKVPNEFHQIIAVPGKRPGHGKRVHINSCKPYRAKQIAKVVIAMEDPELIVPCKRLYGGGVR